MFEGLRFSNWKAETQVDGIVVLTLDRADASVNALNHATLEELAQIVERLSIEPPKGVVIHSGKNKGFIAGADIREFQTYEKQGSVLANIEYGQRVFQSLSRLRCPTVAAINGYLHGGRHRNGAGLPLPRCHARSEHEDRPARSDARHPSRLGRYRAFAAIDRRAGSVAADVDRQSARRRAGEGDGNRRRAHVAGITARNSERTDSTPARTAARATSARVGNQHLAGAPDPRAHRSQADGSQGASRPISRTVRADRSMAPWRLEHGATLETRSPIRRKARADSNGEKSHPSVLFTRTPQRPWRRSGFRSQTCSRRWCRRDGRRHRRVVRVPRLRRDAARSRDEIHPARAGSRAGSVQEAA